MSSNDQPKFTNARLRFFVPPAGDVRSYFDILKPDGKTFERNYTTEEKHVFIENLRVREQENTVTLDGEGFQLFSDCPTTFRDFHSEEKIVGTYYPESIELTKKLTGASQVIIVDHSKPVDGCGKPYESDVVLLDVRRRRLDSDLLAPGQPSRRVHVDFSASQALSILQQSVPVSETPPTLQRRFQILSFWRPISHAAYDSPLVLCDYKTVNMQEDTVPMTTVRPEGEVEVVAVKYSENHKWGYFYGVTPGEVVLIKS